MRGHEPILKLRTNKIRRMKPSLVFVKYDMPVENFGPYDRPFNRLAVGLSPVVYVDKGERPDMRFLTDCKVVFEEEEPTKDGLKLAQRIIHYSPSKLWYIAGPHARYWGEWEKGKWEWLPEN